MIYFRVVEYLQKVESSNLKDFNLARAGHAIKRQQSFAQKTKDRRILQYADALRAGELTVYHFLEVCAQFFEPAVLPIVPAEEPPHVDHSVKEMSFFLLSSILQTYILSCIG